MNDITPSLSSRRRIAVVASLLLAASSVVAVGVAPANAAEQTKFCPQGQYCAWEDDLKQGQIFNNKVSMNYVGDSWNDRFSSLENRQSRAAVFFEEHYYGGDERVVQPGEEARQLQWEFTDGGASWNDRISSVAVG
ncbi:peptidase inhibitor family I36 protein [Rathayibacter rathayi]|uniref:peptidase inhibitor family I36 protein n=1 Tax=Rathayibacter rathayi TaxID=33887 RepID=UPI000CE7AAA0|nr:peptidase inhibitor family I36 protein [Rathayibacter rathayi]PPF23722.1 hypothetical protein C5C34_07480 [Rathayibacter rathayi]PPG93106.1 hypothetical protein C5C22_11775 [Rathayibacter rathayi]